MRPANMGPGLVSTSRRENDPMQQISVVLGRLLAGFGRGDSALFNLWDKFHGMLPWFLASLIPSLPTLLRPLPTATTLQHYNTTPPTGCHLLLMRSRVTGTRRES